MAASGHPGGLAVALASTTFCSTFHLNGLMHQTRVLYLFAVESFHLILTSFWTVSLTSFSALLNVIVSTLRQEHFEAVLDLSGRGAISPGHFPMPVVYFIYTATTKY